MCRDAIRSCRGPPGLSARSPQPSRLSRFIPSSGKTPPNQHGDVERHQRSPHWGTRSGTSRLTYPSTASSQVSVIASWEICSSVEILTNARCTFGLVDNAFRPQGVEPSVPSNIEDSTPVQKHFEGWVSAGEGLMCVHATAKQSGGPRLASRHRP